MEHFSPGITYQILSPGAGKLFAFHSFLILIQYFNNNRQICKSIGCQLVALVPYYHPLKFTLERNKLKSMLFITYSKLFFLIFHSKIHIFYELIRMFIWICFKIKRKTKSTHALCHVTSRAATGPLLAT